MTTNQPPILNGTTLPISTPVPIAMSAEQQVPTLSTEPIYSEPEPATTEPPAVSGEREKEIAEMRAKWPGWPGYSVFRIVVPVLKVGGIIGRKGDLIKKLVEETRARIRILDGPVANPDRIVLVSGKEEPEAAISPAMDAVLRIFKRVNGLPENDADGNTPGTAGVAHCSIRLLVGSMQAISLIGKQGSMIKSIQESSGASVRVLSNDEGSIYATSDERVVEVQGEGLKVLKALEGVVGHLRKFLVDQGVLPLFEKNYNAAPAPVTQERPLDFLSERALLHSITPLSSSLVADYPVSVKRESLFLDRGSQLESHLASSRLASLYGSDHGLGSRPSTIGRSGGPVVTQVAQTMQIPLDYAEDIIGVQGANIEYIRRTSGAILTVQESRGLPEEITVEIKGTASQVEAAQQLIQEFTNNHRDPPQSSYSKLESSLRSSYSQPGSNSYSSSSLSGQPYGGGYGSSGGAGGYSSFRL